MKRYTLEQLISEHHDGPPIDKKWDEIESQGQEIIECQDQKVDNSQKPVIIIKP